MQSGIPQSTASSKRKKKKNFFNNNDTITAYQNEGSSGSGGDGGGDSHGLPAHHYRRRARHSWVALRHQLNESLVASAHNGMAGVRSLPNMDALVVSMRAKV